MLSSVVPAQRWGVTGADGLADKDDAVALKNGWYPAENGWRVNSVDIIMPKAGREPAYAVAVLTNRQESMRYGISTIEGVFSLIHLRLRLAN